jgi:hypothetical protein
LAHNEKTEQNHLSFHHIRKQQHTDAKLLAVQQKFLQNYICKCLDDNVEGIIHYIKDFLDSMMQWKIALPEPMLKETVNWFH